MCCRSRRRATYSIARKGLDFSDVAVGESKGQNWESDWHIMIRVIVSCHSQPTGGVFVASKPFSCKKWSESLWKTVFLEVSSNHCSWNDWFSMEMFHNFLLIVRTGLKSAGLKCGVRKTSSYRFWRPCIKAYLPGREVLTTITKVVPPGRGCSIALRSGWPLRFPQMWETRRRHFC